MIKVKLYHQGSSITGFQIVGHAGEAQYGHDIVCSAVSVLSINTINSLTEIAGIHPQVKKDAINGGLLIMKVPAITDATQNLKVQTLLRGFKLGMQAIANSYSKYVSFKILK